jgi:hypothetical protein
MHSATTNAPESRHRVLLVELDPLVSEAQRMAVIETPQNVLAMVETEAAFAPPAEEKQSRNGDAPPALDLEYALTHERYDCVVILGDAYPRRQQLRYERKALAASRAPVLIADRDGKLIRASRLRVLFYALPYRIVRPVQAGVKWLKLMTFKSVLSAWLRWTR